MSCDRRASNGAEIESKRQNWLIVVGGSRHSRVVTAWQGAFVGEGSLDPGGSPDSKSPQARWGCEISKSPVDPVVVAGTGEDALLKRADAQRRHASGCFALPLHH